MKYTPNKIEIRVRPNGIVSAYQRAVEQLYPTATVRVAQALPGEASLSFVLDGGRAEATSREQMEVCKAISRAAAGWAS